MTRVVLLAWSSGKDSAWCLHRLRGQRDVEVVGLLTSVDESDDRVAMHATRRSILEAQARSADLPLDFVPLPWPCPNEIYEERMHRAFVTARARGVTHLAFGDLFLEEIRAYRIRQLAGTGLQPIFPLWRQPTAALARRMIDAGLEAVLTCVDPERLAPSFVGRRFDHALLDELPAGVDPCGENGEFHTCVLAGPMFRRPIRVAAGETIERDGFVMSDLVLQQPSTAGRSS
ncbi:MAG: ATP-binding protein [Acidobacteriota bacterium]